MKQLLTLVAFTACAYTYAQWKPAGDKIDINKLLPEYPFPIMERGQWQNLNRLWNYAILSFKKYVLQIYNGKILLWSHDFPFLYTMKCFLFSNGKLMDQLSNYAAIRKYSTKGNNKYIVNLGFSII